MLILMSEMALIRTEWKKMIMQLTLKFKDKGFIDAVVVVHCFE